MGYTVRGLCTQRARHYSIRCMYIARCDLPSCSCAVFVGVNCRQDKKDLPRQASVTIIVVTNMRLALLTFVFPTAVSAFVAPLLVIARTRTSTLLFARPSKKASEETENSKPGPNLAKKAALDGVLQQIERSYGRGSILKLGDAESMVVDSIGSGALTLGEWYMLCLWPLH